MTIYEDEIDLRPYIEAILNSWWKILILALVFAIIVFGITLLQPRSYQATATILVPRSQLQLSLADQFRTIVDAGDTRSRRDAYLTIAQSDAIAVQTYQALEDQIPEEATVADLQASVEITNEGDAILIAATAPTPQLAADIANEWAKQTVQAINLAYSGQQPLEEIQSQIISASTNYQDAQTELEEFIATNSITELETAIQLAEAGLDSYLQDKAWQANYRYQQRQQLLGFYDQTSLVKNQVENGNASNAGNFGDALAVMNTRIFPAYNVIGIDNIVEGSGYKFSNISDGIGIQLTDATVLLDTSSNYVQDIDSTLEITEQAIQGIEQDLEDLATSSYLGSENAYTSLASEIQALEAQLENLTARERELTSERDLAWETYETLLQKETEIKTTSQTNAEVTFASPAIPPEEPESRQTLMKTAIAGILGGIIGILWVIIRMWWQSNQVPESTDNHSITPEN
jgi:uncharacterized protein involved in exopolysaccharide biosynthesis